MSLVRGGGGQPPAVDRAVELWRLARDVRKVTMEAWELLLTDRVHKGTAYRARAALAAIDEVALGLEMLDRALVAGSRKATVREIEEALAVLVSAYPMSGNGNSQGFGVLLKQDVGDEQPSVWALAAAGRRLRKTCSFLPKISEVIEALQEEEDALARTAKAVRDLPGIRQRIESDMAALR